ncbi:MAG: ester cyclase [Chloroflexi bacterium]|nr:ester cyclase [Chloroflexota bacterium]
MHEPWQDWLLGYINGTLADDERTALEQHLADCADCRMELEDWRLLAQGAAAEVESLKGTLPPLVLPGNSRYAPRSSGSSQSYKPNQWKDKKMFFSHTLRLPASPRQLNVPLTLIAALAITLIVGTILIFNRAPALPVILGPLQQEDTPSAAFERYINEVWNEGNLDVLDDFLAPDFSHYDAGLPAPITDIEGLKAYISRFRSNLPGVTFTVDQIVEDGAEVFARLTAAGDGFSVPITASVSFNPWGMEKTWLDAGTLLETRLAELYRLGALVGVNSPASIKEMAQWYQQVMTGHGFYGTSQNNPTNLSGWFALWQNSFPDLNCVTTRIAAENDTVLVHYACEGTFQNAFAPYPDRVINPTGEKMQWDNLVIIRVEDGKAAEFWWYESNPLFWEVEGSRLADARAQREVPISSIEDVLGVWKLKTSSGVLRMQLLPDGTVNIGNSPACADCISKGKFAVEGGQIHWFNPEALYDVFVTREDGQPAKLRFALVGEDSYSDRMMSLDGKTLVPATP